ncbi:MAG: ammonium transporter, partial [Patescibacteria group bacterium]|nr:ammonium transporter [Patescibacteria group bacterium]
RVKNVVHTMAMNLVIYAIGVTGFWISGFALMFGGVGPLSTLGNIPILNHEVVIHILGKPFGLFGLQGFFLSGQSYDVAIFTLFLFQMVFMDTAATIPTGAMAERWKFLSFVIYGFFMSMILYPIYGNWVWGGGWLAQLGNTFGMGHGVVDFAGSGVVHMVGGWTALAGAMILGPRIGKYKKNGKPNTIAAHNIPMAVLGALILAFGWFGFNPGSTLAATDLRIGVIAVNTMLASAAGALSAMLIMWKKTGKPDLAMTTNGFLAGLVAVTAPCAFINAYAAFIIGLIAGVFVVIATFFVESVLRVDDPVGAVAVHGVNGAWGILALGLFADGTYGSGWNGISGNIRGLLYGDRGQFFAQSIDVIVNFVFVFAVSYLFFKALHYVIGMRVSPEVELAGLDITEMGLSGYPESFVPEYSPRRKLKRKRRNAKRLVLRPAYVPVED